MMSDYMNFVDVLSVFYKYLGDTAKLNIDNDGVCESVTFRKRLTVAPNGYEWRNGEDCHGAFGPNYWNEETIINCIRNHFPYDLTQMHYEQLSLF